MWRPMPAKPAGVERFLSRRPGRGRPPFIRDRPGEAGPAKPTEGQQAMTKTITSDLVAAYSVSVRRIAFLTAVV